MFREFTKLKVYVWKESLIVVESGAFFFSQKNPHSISYKILQMRVLYTKPYMDTIVPSYVDAH